MKKLFLLVSFCLSTIVCLAEDKKIVIVTASYNNKQWYKKNLDSIFHQMKNYENCFLIYIDDCSSDGTGELVDKYVANSGYKDRIEVIHNKERHGALYNLYHAIHSCADNAIVITLDGDDWFPVRNVVGYINNVYQDSNVWLTYGQFKEYPSGVRGFCCPIPKHIVEHSGYRYYHLTPSHLRTFYAGLFKRIKKEDFMWEGKFFPMTWDQAMMFPMLEMAAGKFKFTSDILCIYNGANPINDHKVSKDLQQSLSVEVRCRPRYKKIESLFEVEL